MGLSNEWANKWRQWVAAMDQRSVDMLQGLAGSRRARGLVVGGAAAVLLGLAGWSLRPLPDDGEGLAVLPKHRRWQSLSGQCLL